MRRQSVANRPLAFLLCLACLAAPGCFVRRRVITRQGKRETRPLLTATKEELIAKINAVSGPIESFSANVEMTPSLGSVYKGELTDYATVTGYILFRKPADIRIIGLDPVIHSKAFDMVSTGLDFRVYIPVKNRFIEGRNDAPATSKNKLENLRPSAFLTSLMIYPPDAKTETTLLEDDTDEDHAWYILLMVARDHDGLRLNRGIYFDRYTLQILRQKTLDASGGTVSDTRYSEWKLYSGVSFPSNIDISRPQDGYELAMTVTTMKMNPGDIGPDKFLLNPPPGAQVQQLP